MAERRDRPRPGYQQGRQPARRCAAIELSWLWLRHQPESALTRWFRSRTHNNASKRNKRIAVVALARKLMVALWRYLTTAWSRKEPCSRP